MTDFYKKDGSYYTADTNTKIADLNALNTLAKAGGKEVTYTPPAPVMSNQAGFGTYAQNRSVVSSNTLNAGLTAPSIQEALPSANTQAQLSYTQDTQANYEKQLSDLKATQLKEAEQARKQAEVEYKTIQDEKQGKINTYDAQMNPLADTARNEYSRMLGSLGNIDYNKLTSDRMSLTNDVVEYSKLMRQELDQEASRPALASVSQGRQNSIKENYTSKIATSQAALQAIDGNFSLAFDIMDKGANAINQLTTDRINFLNTIKGLYDSKEENAYNKILNLSADEKKLIERAITDLENKQKLVEENKKEIMKLMEDNPLIANKAGLLLTDTAEQRAEKLNKLYTKNPQYLPENQAILKKLIENYPDAGITINDTIAQAQSKLVKSKTYLLNTQYSAKEQIELLSNGFSVNPDTGKIEVDVSNANADQIAEAIKQVESGGNYNAKGASGEFGAYQFMPGTWTSWATEYASKVLGKSQKLEMTPENQEAVAKFKISQWLSQGMTPQQIAAKWNSGSEVGWENKIGTNSQGVAYNVPAYVNKVIGALGSIVQPTTTTLETSQQDPEAYDWAMSIQDGTADFSDITGNPTLKSRVNSILRQLPPPEKEIKNAEKMVKELEALRDHAGLNSAVGTGAFGLNRIPLYDLGGNKQNFLGQANKLVSQNALDKLIEAKSQGATFGALSDREMSILKSASTALGTWELTNDKDKVKGYDISQKAFKEEIQKMIDGYNELIVEATGRKLITSGQTPSGIAWSVQKTGGQTTPSGISYEVIP